MTKKQLVKSLEDLPDEADIIIEVLGEDDKIHAAEPTAIWVRSTGTIILSNDD